MLPKRFSSASPEPGDMLPCFEIFYELLTLLPLILKLRDYIGVPPILVYVMLEIKQRTSCMPGKHANNGAHPGLRDEIP